VTRFVIPEGGKPSSAPHSGRSNTIGRRSKGSAPRRHSGPAGGVVPETADATTVLEEKAPTTKLLHHPVARALQSRRHMACRQVPNGTEVERGSLAIGTVKEHRCT
jgi:hypothetical protein